MTKDQAINYLYSSGMSEEQVNEVVTAIEQKSKYRKKYKRWKRKALEQQPTVEEMEREYEKSKALFHKIVECEDAVSREAVREHLKKRMYETAFNNVGVSDDIDQVYKDIIENRLNTWLDELPSVTVRQTGEWIPVSERLPEEKVEILVTTRWGSITIGERYSANDYFINDGASNADENEIIAWMPLPEPYKEEGAE